MRTIEAREVKVGDFIYNSSTSTLPKVAKEAFQWVRVISVEAIRENAVRIETTVWSAVKHIREAIAVRD